MVGKVIIVQDVAYVVKKQIRPWFEKAINHYGTDKIKEKLDCDRIVKYKNNDYLLLEKIKEAIILAEYIKDNKNKGKYINYEI